jgi:FeS assembly SUF system protein
MSDVSTRTPRVTEPLVVDAIRQCFDPEIPVNIYELGLIYGITIDPAGAVAIRMTLTAPSCPAAQTLPADVEAKVRALPGVTGVQVEVVFDPPWESCMMSDAAKLQLGML